MEMSLHATEPDQHETKRVHLDHELTPEMQELEKMLFIASAPQVQAVMGGGRGGTLRLQRMSALHMHHDQALHKEEDDDPSSPAKQTDTSLKQLTVHNMLWPDHHARKGESLPGEHLMARPEDPTGPDDGCLQEAEDAPVEGLGAELYEISEFDAYGGVAGDHVHDRLQEASLASDDEDAPSPESPAGSDGADGASDSAEDSDGGFDDLEWAHSVPAQFDDLLPEPEHVQLGDADQGDTCEELISDLVILDEEQVEHVLAQARLQCFAADRGLQPTELDESGAHAESYH